MEVKDLEKGAWLARTFSVLIIPTLSPGNNCKGCSAQAGLQEGQVAREELRAPPDHGSPQSPLACVPFKPRWSQVSSPFLRSLTLPLHPPSLHPMLIYNLQPPGQSPFFLTLHCPIATSYPVQDLASQMRETGKGERSPENSRSPISFIHLASSFFHLRTQL